MARRWKKRRHRRTAVASPSAEVEEDVTSELSKLIERPRRSTTTPPPIPRARVSSTEITPLTPTIGDWSVGFELGRGGMSTVYAVSHREFGKRAALKLSHTAKGSGLGADQFLREARVVQLVEHPAIPDVFATGCHEGRPYLVMERLRGETLTQLMERGGLEQEHAIEILIEVCDALAAAHESGVVHCDLKLDNVFVLNAPNATRIKLLDWGFARALDEDDPFPGMLAGTLSCVAPERIDGTVTPASDVYSLGVLMQRLLKQPSKSLAQVMTAMVAKEPLCRPTVAEVRAALVATRPRRRSVAMARLERTRTFSAMALVMAVIAMFASVLRRAGVPT